MMLRFCMPHAGKQAAHICKPQENRSRSQLTKLNACRSQHSMQTLRRWIFVCHGESAHAGFLPVPGAQLGAGAQPRPRDHPPTWRQLDELVNDVHVVARWLCARCGELTRVVEARQQIL